MLDVNVLLRIGDVHRVVKQEPSFLVLTTIRYVVIVSEKETGYRLHYCDGLRLRWCSFVSLFIVDTSH